MCDFVTGDNDVRAVEQLKARYCRTLDTKQWTEFRELLADDFVGDTTASGGFVTTGADRFVAFLERSLARAATVHQVQQPEIEIISATAATATWAMLDIVRFSPGLTLHGFGHYHETYEKSDGRWRIKSLELTRLWEEIRTPVFSIFLSDRIRRRILRAAARLGN